MKAILFVLLFFTISCETDPSIVNCIMNSSTFTKIMKKVIEMFPNKNWWELANEIMKESETIVATFKECTKKTFLEINLGKEIPDWVKKLVSVGLKVAKEWWEQGGADLVRKKCNELAPDNIKWACKLIP